MSIVSDAAKGKDILKTEEVHVMQSSYLSVIGAYGSSLTF